MSNVDALDALDALIEAVEKGVNPDHIDFFGPIDGLNDDGDLGLTARNAFHGSLDAAKALHDALLPGWLFGVNEVRPGTFRANISPWSALRPMPTICDNANPARAWLLAILKAYRAQVVK